MSIDDATPEEWNKMGFKTIKDERSKATVASPVDYTQGGVYYNGVLLKGEPAEKNMVESYDAVNNPAHYNTGSIECIDAMEAMLSEEEFIGYLRGNSFKYRWRMRHKESAVKDLQKAQWYERKLQNIIEGTDNDK
tara:strand:- start:675 stop:1079 length:405 start_codon:yes stop_codon:yes gene_type:complete